MGNAPAQLRDPFDDDTDQIGCSLLWVLLTTMGNSNAAASPPKGKKVLLAKLATADKTGVLNLADQDLKPNSSIWLKISQDGLLPKLKSLDISGNAIKGLPGELNMMTNLKSLHAARSTLQRTHDISSLNRLTQLNLDGNDLEVDVFGPLPTSLQKLSVAQNHFKTVPHVLSTLVNVIELNLGGNRIENTNGLGLLVALVDLNLDENALVEVSEDLGLLTNLRHLSLKLNKIGKSAVTREGQSIPEFLFVNTALDSIDLSNNPLLTKAMVMDFAGVDVFLERRKRTKDKAFQGGAMLDVSLFGDLA